ncbi:3722_t:CDS:2 [Ambispora gerdemannii]|uniref:3722_t:CDS:1 n=1 Tax=Ambispora gerdemannii TaxID=144530 RepID=A0A9N9GYF0_9GLOM|nr:3722_t:CDS:2 [Ambispora gerdemannii]
MSKESINEAAELWIVSTEDAVDNGTWEQEGWSTQEYGVSKTGVTTLSHILARRFKAEVKNILVNTCCPGWVKTDMAGPRAPLTPDQGVKTLIFLALDEETVSNGELWKLK